MLHEYDGAVHHEKTTLDAAPSLLVLHEISSYFDARSSEATVSAYLSVVSSALTLANSWSPRCSTTSKLVVFDSGLGDLKLPILRPLSFTESEEGEGTPHRRDTLSVLLERYFEWQAEAAVQSPGEVDGTNMDEDQPDMPTFRSMTLTRCGAGGGDESDTDTVVWRWSEVVETRELGMPHTSFRWDISY
ncbi:hypothetical protein C8Q77DRAFT_422029 [Trametes polyzona]|nr:hypothetical protein C8Q77DRAFT_422029 [Trametes polyzona]